MNDDCAPISIMCCVMILVDVRAYSSGVTIINIFAVDVCNTKVFIVGVSLSQNIEVLRMGFIGSVSSKVCIAIHLRVGVDEWCPVVVFRCVNSVVRAARTTPYKSYGAVAAASR